MLSLKPSVTAIEYDTDAAWHNIRRRHVTGTDVAALMGCSPWNTALDAYLDKTVGTEPLENNDAMRFGRLFEAPILAELAHRIDRRIETPKAVLRNEAHPRICGTFDGAVLRHDQPYTLDVSTWEAGAEAKTARQRWNAGVPEHYLWQVQTYLMISALPYWWVAAMHGVNDIEVYQIYPDRERHAAIEQVVDALWQAVDSGVPPEPSWQHPAVLESVRRLNATKPAPEVVPVELQGDAVEALCVYARAKVEMEAAEKAKSEALARIEHAMNGATKAIGGGYSVTLSKRSRTSYSVPREVQEQYPAKTSEYTVPLVTLLSDKPAKRTKKEAQS